jgi:hypothetical protein
MTSPDLRGVGKLGRAGSAATTSRGAALHSSGRLGAALDVARTLLVLTFIGSGIVLLRFLLVLARGAFGH